MWYTNHLTGKQLLALLGNTNEQRDVLGGDFDGVLEAIEGGPVRPPLVNLLGVNHGQPGQKRARDLMDPTGRTATTKKLRTSQMSV
jgi:hypothetical protein